VLGGGPAGSAAARLLAECGRRVLVLCGPAPRRPGSAESLPPSCRKPLQLLDALPAIAAANFLPCSGNTTAWGGAAPRIETFGAAGSGLQVERAVFDALLLRLAGESGARVVAGTATAVHSGGEGAGAPHAASGGGVAASAGTIVDWVSAEVRSRVRARWVLDASGRAGVIARGKGLRVRDGSPPTTALIGVWRARGEWRGVEPSHTVVESYRDGWVWSVPVADGRRWVAAMVDPRVTRLSRRDGRAALYHAEVAKTSLMRRLLHDAELLGEAWACPATTYTARRFAGAGFLLVGDAGSFLDPLSSAGVKKALASGCLAAIVTNTCLADAGRTAAAIELFEEREREAYVRYSRHAAGFYAAAGAAHDHAFWERRARAYATMPGHETGESELRGALDHDTGDPRLRGALDALRAGACRVRPSPVLQMVMRPTVEGREVVMRQHVAAPAGTRGIRYFGSIELPALVGAARAGASLPRLFAAYERRHPGARAQDMLGAVASLVAWGMLEICEDTDGYHALHSTQPVHEHAFD
jgi:flavin-dependent dehydrogenase